MGKVADAAAAVAACTRGVGWMVGLVRLGLASGHEVVDEVDGQREDDGGVLLSADARQGLQIAKLQKNSRWEKNLGLPKKFFFSGGGREMNMKSFC